MSNPVENTPTLPPEMWKRIDSFLPEKPLFSMRQVSTFNREIVDYHLWNSLKNSPPKGPIDLKNRMERIEQNKSDDTPYLHLFKRLTKTCVDMGAGPIELALTESNFSKLQMHSKLAHDESLLAIWPKILSELNIPNLHLNTAEEIHTWMNDPNNSDHLRIITRLHLSNLKLRVLPPEIAKLTQLRWLFLRQNKLVSLPAEIGSLKHLQGFLLSQNQLASLPAEIGSLAQLQTLDLSENQLASLPVEIGSLAQLHWLILHQNQLASLPAEIGSLVQLEGLLLHQNKLAFLPDEIGNLVHLLFLNLEQNLLTSLPAEIGSLPLLIELRLKLNQLTSIPTEIGSLPRLTVVGFKNQLPKGTVRS